jgi:c-di-GMP-binding flagellar brake protein YcgR
MRDLPRVNQKVELSVPQGEGEISFSSWVQEVEGERVAIASPMRGEELFFVPQGTEVTLYYHDQRGFFALFGEVEDQWPDPPALVVRVGEVRRDQRRRFYRWEATLPVRFVPREEGEKIAPWDWGREEYAWFEGVTKDISGGGMLLLTSFHLHPGEEIWLELSLPSGPLRALGRVVRVVGEGREKAYGVEFQGLGRKDQDRICRYIFGEQARLRRLGLI